jgi:hypothetical protein
MVRDDGMTRSSILDDTQDLEQYRHESVPGTVAEDGVEE